MTRYLMGLDLGGKKGCCLLLDVEAGESVTTCRWWRHRMTAGFGYDLDTVEVWRLLGEATREAMAKVGARPQDVLAVSTTGMRHGSVVVDARGECCLRPRRGTGAARCKVFSWRANAGASFTGALDTFPRHCLRLRAFCGWRSQCRIFSAGRMRCWD